MEDSWEYQERRENWANREQNRKVRRVAVLIETTRAYGRRIMDGIAAYVRENPFWQIFVEPRALYDPLPHWLKTWDGDGIIARVGSPKDRQALEQLGLPVVHLKGVEKVSKGLMPDIYTDRQAVGQLAATHLIERHFRHFAFVGIPNCSWSNLELAGFQKTLEEASLSCHVFQHKKGILKNYRDGAMEDEIDMVSQWLKTLPMPIGILAADDFLGVQLLSACYQLGIHVPEMAAVVGVGDEETVCRLAFPTLSSVRPNEHLIGRKAAALLDRLMEGYFERPDPEKIPPLKVVTRHSTDVQAVDDPVVRQALAFIRENISEPIGVQDILDHVNVSRSVLQRRFQKECQKSIYETILDTKIRFVMELLTDTDFTMRKVARIAGFKHVVHLNSIFKQKTGTTLSEYRRKIRALVQPRLSD
ncbi:MAG: DNA-binding transcriptional regulator [Planctomycetia bacterium]|nr:DNA-binding transcriptional regulator [Planctomycetia bacterium]